MPIQILMPAMSPTMTHGTLVRWHKQEGDTIKSGDILADIETDKATMEVEAADEGILAKILVPEGFGPVAVNQIIAILLEDSESMDDLDKLNKDIPQKQSPPKCLDDPDPCPIRPKASPLAKRIAYQKNIDLLSISGTGPNKRIVAKDVYSCLENAPPLNDTQSLVSKGSPPSKKEEIPQLTPTQDFTDHPTSSMRKVIAERLCESKQTIPHFYLSLECILDELLKLRSEINTKSLGEKISVNDWIVKACALALQRIPEMNVSFHGTFVRRYTSSDVCVAVSVEDGLYTPVIRDAHKKSLLVISQEIKELAKRARSFKLAPEQYQGGSLTVSNLGMFGIKKFSAIINPPQSCILAVGASCEQAVVHEGSISIKSVMNLTLSVDHRCIDGVLAAQFISLLKELLENPWTLVL